MMASRRSSEQPGRTQAPIKEIYFHIKNSQEVRLVPATCPNLPPLRECDAYYTTECTRKSKPNPELRIPSDVTKRVKDTLQKEIDERNSEPSVTVLGFSFQARFGYVNFQLPRREWQEVSTDIFRDRPAIFHFEIPFDAQHFILGECVESAVETHTKYKVSFSLTNSSIEAACQVAEEDDHFKLIWTRITTTERSQNLKKMIRFDVVRPRTAQVKNRVDIRIVGLSQISQVSEDSEVHKIAEEITKSMTRSPSGELSMLVLSDKFKVHFVRKKSMRTYKWKDDQDWNIIDCDAHNCTNIECDAEKDKCVPIPVHFQEASVKEIYFNSATHYTKPTGDPDVRESSPEEYLSHFENFVEASFRMAEMLEDTV